ncbi:hypothetical protein AMJ82_10715 [candidate division TA06 bacterium SM23_40]|uniref:Outer membrane protein beta-barrel domain-containing protein n=1 Tax=candidate division TA06 bacterium SM23_40 TaxID=1703774 RepID=A0A0S8G366_UNCT6|nr:MAG: hypothetical protein AMJ82_10715 [candidate division TA06 bacterium SM23_40]
MFRTFLHRAARWAILIAVIVPPAGWGASGSDAASSSVGPEISESSGGPVLGVVIDRYRDVSRLRNEMNILSFRMGEALVSGSAVREMQRNETVDRTKETTTADIRISYPVSGRVSLEFAGRGDLSSDEGEAYRNRSSRREVTGSIHYRVLPTLTVTQSLQVVADRYSRRAGRARQIIDNDGIADHMYIEGDAVVGDGRRVGFTYDGEYRRQEVTGTRRRDLSGFAAGRIGEVIDLRLDVHGSQHVDEYPIGVGEEERQEKRERLQGGGEVSCNVAWPRKLHLSLLGRASRTRTDFEGRTASLSGSGDRETSLNGIQGALAYRPGDRLALEISLGTEREVADFRDPNSPDDEDQWSRSGGLTAEYRFGEGRSVAFVHRLSLDSHYFAHPAAQVPRSLDERDVLRTVTEATTRLPLSQNTTIGAALAHRSEELIYVRSERSANSRDHDTYEFTSRVELIPSTMFIFGQSYGLSADYNVYPFDDDKNRVIRTLTVESDVAVALSQQLGLKVEHGLEREDQGRYPEVAGTGELRYERDQELRRQRVGVSLEYRLGRDFEITPRYAYLETERFDIVSDPATQSFERVNRDRRRERTYGVAAHFMAVQRTDITFRSNLIERDGEERYWDIDAAFRWEL